MKVRDAARDAVADARDELDGKTLGKPTLLVSDGMNLTYGVDVDIGETQINPDNGDEEIVPLRNVMIAPGNNELIYADTGAAVRLRRSTSGRYEIIGFSKRFPGTYTRVPVTIPDAGLAPIPYTIGTPQSIGLSSRRLTYAELETLGRYGATPYGAIGFFRGGILEEVH